MAKGLRSLKYGIGNQITSNPTIQGLKNMGLLSAQMLPMSDIARETGLSSIEPTIYQDLINKRYMDALLKGISTAGDIGTGTGAIMMGTGAGAPLGAAVIGASQLAKLAAKAVTKKPIINKEHFYGLDQKNIYDRDNAFALIDMGVDRAGGIKAIDARHKYNIFLPNKEKSVGTVSLIQGKEDTIKGLVNIEIVPEARKSGLGKKIVKALSYLSENPKGLEITDIQRNAINFWRKLGLTDEAKMFPKDKTSYSKKGFIPNPDINIDKAIGGRVMRDPNKNYNEQRFI